MPDMIPDATTIVLTGGTDGIGRVLCERLLGEGHMLVVLARRALAMPPFPGLHPIACDLSDPAAVRAAADRIAAQHPGMTMLINNAAFQYDRALSDPELDLDCVEDELVVNLLAPAILTSRLLPVLQAHGRPSAVVNINSGLAIFPKQRTALYCATKAGLHSLSQSLRYQLRTSRTRVLEVFLPLVDTAMTRGRGSGKMSPEAAADRILAGIRRGDENIWVGKARLIPLLNGLVPALGRRALRGPR